MEYGWIIPPKVKVYQINAAFLELLNALEFCGARCGPDVLKDEEFGLRRGVFSAGYEDTASKYG